MADSRILYIPFLLLVLVTTVGGCIGTATTHGPTPSPTLSEQPDMVTFHEYFSDISLGRLPPGGEMPFDLQRNVSVFASDDNMQLCFTVIKEVQINVKNYNVATKQEWDLGSRLIKPVGFAQRFTASPGKWEMRIYAGDVLVAVLPFEVSSQTSAATPEPTLSEQPDEAIFSKYFSDMGLGLLPKGGQMPFDLQKNVTVFSPDDNIQLYGTVIREVQITVKCYGVPIKREFGIGSPPSPIEPGDFGSGVPSGLPAGDYELRVHVGDVLVAVLPFEIR